jgi:hypothetical protein
MAHEHETAEQLESIADETTEAVVMADERRVDSFPMTPPAQACLFAFVDDLARLAAELHTEGRLRDSTEGGLPCGSPRPSPSTLTRKQH